MSGPEQQWRDALAEGKLLLPGDCKGGECFYPPRVAAPGSGNDWEWVEASGRGSVHSVSTIHPRPPAEPYRVMILESPEGGRMLCRSAEELPIGTPVEARFEKGKLTFKRA